MGKSVGFIGNFKGKLGNTVGYKLSASNSGTNQGVRVYQPNIKNPKSAAQAEQRAKYAPIFATYRALKMIIDRGNESKPYGNASRIAWLKSAFRSKDIAWIEKGNLINYPIGCVLSHGSLKNILFNTVGDSVRIWAEAATQGASVHTVSAVTTILMNSYSFLKEGDQITLITSVSPDSVLAFNIQSFILNKQDQSIIETFHSIDGSLDYQCEDTVISAAIIVSREGANGKHLRSTSELVIDSNALAEYPYRSQDKQSAIASYMATNSANADWAEEIIQ